MKITKKDFAEWLDSRYGEVVGIRAEVDRCPLASYFADKYDLLYVSVGVKVVEYQSSKTGREHQKALPKWCERFVSKVDSGEFAPEPEEDAYDYHDYYDVYSDEALKILRTLLLKS